jgi:hypothetical protein
MTTTTKIEVDDLYDMNDSLSEGYDILAYISAMALLILPLWIL